MPFVSLLLAAATATTPTYGAPPPPDAKAALEYMYQCEREWAAIAMTGSTAVIDRCVAEDAIQISASGAVRDRGVLKSVIGASAPAAGLADASVMWLSADFAIIIGKSWSEQAGTREWKIFSDTWQRRNGRWYIVFTHSAVWEPPAPAPAAAPTPASPSKKP